MQRNRTVPFWRRMTVLVCIFLLGGTGTSTRLFGRTEVFQDRTSVVVVEVPVEVVDDEGRPVRGLTAENFEILDDGKPREVAYFEVLDRGEAAPRGVAETAVAARRHFLLLFDLSFSTPSAMLRARTAASGFLDRLHPSDLVGVATFSLLQGPRLVVNFTPDRTQARLAIETLGAPQLTDRAPDPLGLVLSSTLQDQGPSAGSAPSAEGGSRFQASQSEREQVVRQFLESAQRNVNQADREVQANRIQGLMNGLGNLASALKAADGRKYVVYLSEGFDSRLLTGETDREMAQKANDAIVSGEVWDVDTTELYGSGRSQNALEAMLETFRRSDCTIQAVDIGGLRGEGEATSAPGGQEGLFALARGTGGELYRNFNDLGQAMGRMLQRTSVTYLLSFQPEDLTADGTFRKLKVRLRNAPRGARIVHRPGYFAPRPEAPLSREEQRLAVASDLLSTPNRGEIRVAALAVPFRRPEGGSAVPVLLEIDGASLLGGRTAGQASTEIYLYALTEQNEVEDFLYQTLTLDLAKVADRLRQGGVKFYGELSLVPGHYDLRVLVRDPASGRSGLISSPVEIPEPVAGELVVLPPLVPDSVPERWLMVRQASRGGEAALEYPFVVEEGSSFVPAARPMTAAGSPMQLGVFAYDLRSASPTLNAQLLDDRGNVVLGQQLPILQRHSATDGGPDRLFTAFATAGVPPGLYTLSVGVYEAAGRRQLSSVPLLIVPGTAAEETTPLAAEAVAEASPVRRERSSERQREIAHSYREILAGLRQGAEVQATDALVSLEESVAATTEDVLLSDLRDAEQMTARRLAERDPDALIPLMLLHDRAYLAYRTRDARLVARHSREMVRDLAELYVDSGGSPTSVAAGVFTSLGGSLQQAGLTSSANALFERALQLERDNEAALLSLGVYHEKIGDYDKAADYLERLLEAHPEHDEGWLRWGVNLRRLGKLEAAREKLGRALDARSAPWVRSLAYQELASLSIDGEELEAARGWLEKGLKELPTDQRLRLQLALVLDRLGKPSAARAGLDALEAAVPGEDDSPRYLYNRWPTHVIQNGRQLLATSASSRYAVLARVIVGLDEEEAR